MSISESVLPDECDFWKESEKNIMYVFFLYVMELQKIVAQNKNVIWVQTEQFLGTIHFLDIIVVLDVYFMTFALLSQ